MTIDTQKKNSSVWALSISGYAQNKFKPQNVKAISFQTLENKVEDEIRKQIFDCLILNIFSFYVYVHDFYPFLWKTILWIITVINFNVLHEKASVEMKEYIKYYDTSSCFLLLIFPCLFFFFFYCLWVFHKFPSLSFIHQNIFFLCFFCWCRKHFHLLYVYLSLSDPFWAFSYAHDMIYSQNNSDDNLNYYYTFFSTQMKRCMMKIIYGVPYMIICGYPIHTWNFFTSKITFFQFCASALQNWLKLFTTESMFLKIMI